MTSVEKFKHVNEYLHVLKSRKNRIGGQKSCGNVLFRAVKSQNYEFKNVPYTFDKLVCANCFKTGFLKVKHYM